MSLTLLPNLSSTALPSTSPQVPSRSSAPSFSSSPPPRQHFHFQHPSPTNRDHLYHRLLLGYGLLSFDVLDESSPPSNDSTSRLRDPLHLLRSRLWTTPRYLSGPRGLPSRQVSKTPRTLRIKIVPDGSLVPPSLNSTAVRLVFSVSLASRAFVRCFPSLFFRSLTDRCSPCYFVAGCEITCGSRKEKGSEISVVA